MCYRHGTRHRLAIPHFRYPHFRYMIAFYRTRDTQTAERTIGIMILLRRLFGPVVTALLCGIVGGLALVLALAFVLHTVFHVPIPPHWILIILISLSMTLGTYVRTLEGTGVVT